MAGGFRPQSGPKPFAAEHCHRTAISFASHTMKTGGQVMARNSRRSSAEVSKREREPEQQSRTEKSEARTSKAGQSKAEQGSRGKATVHEFPARKGVGR